MDNPDYKPLKNRTILLTGGARRLGKSIALAAARRGADIVLHYGKSIEEANSTAALIRELGQKAWLIQADLNESNSLRNLIDLAFSYSPLFGLVNNASIFGPGDFMHTSLSEFNQHLQINLTAPFLLSQQFALNYKSPVVGRIINLVDWRALRPGKDHFAYTISKAGLVTMTKSMALSLAPGIAVNAIALGAILPPENELANAAIIKSIPLGRWATITEFEKTIEFLLTGPDYITGEVIHLDGGRHLVH